MLKEKIQKNEKTVGMYVQLSDRSISKIAGLAGYDFVWVDFEHSYMPFETLLGHVMNLQATGTPVIVRAPQMDLTSTKKILEMGVDGIIFPMVRSAAEAHTAIGWTLYPPHGDRGFGPMNAIDYGFADAAAYVKNDRDNLCRFVQIEHKDIIEDLDKLMENPYIDGYIFGPNDLSGSYGRLGDVFSPWLAEIMTDAINKLKKAGKYVAIASGGCSQEVLEYWHSFDPHMLVAGADFELLRIMAVKNRENLERIHKEP